MVAKIYATETSVLEMGRIIENKLRPLWVKYITCFVYYM